MSLGKYMASSPRVYLQYSQDKNWNIAICANLYLFRGLLWTLIEVYIQEKYHEYCVQC